MKNLKFVYVFLLSSIPLIFLCGCSTGREVHEQLVIQGIAIDKEDAGYILTAQAYDFQSPKDEKEPSIRVIEVSGSTLPEALENITQKTSLNPVYSQNMVILMGESVANLGVNNFIDFFIRHCETRPKVKLCVCEGDASKFLKARRGGELIKAQSIHDLISDELNSDVMHFVGNIRGEISDPYAAWIELNQNGENEFEVSFKGIALFHGDIIAGYLEEDEAFGFMLMKGISKFGSCVVFDDVFGEVTCTANKVAVKILSELRENLYPLFKIKLDIDMSAFSFDNKCGGSDDSNNMEKFNNNLETKIQDILQKSLAKIISIGSDAMGFGKILRNMHPEYFKNLNENWKNIMSKCSYEVTQNAALSITGKEIV